MQSYFLIAKISVLEHLEKWNIDLGSSTPN